MKQYIKPQIICRNFTPTRLMEDSGSGSGSSSIIITNTPTNHYDAKGTSFSFIGEDSSEEK